MNPPGTVEGEVASRHRGGPGSPGVRQRSLRGRVFAGYAVLLLAAFGVPLAALAAHALKSDIHSYILLIPFVSVYLVYIERKGLPSIYSTSIGWAAAMLLIAGPALAGSLAFRASLSRNDELALVTLSFVAFLWAGGFMFLGRKWMAAAAFPCAFLVFTVPLPDGAVDWLETALKLASADAAGFFFDLFGVPVVRDGVVFQLPGIVIEVAKECSGINSSVVLFITSLLASHLFLRSPWRRTVLMAVVIPLGVLRNGFRILVIGWLCVEVGPQMINSPIHRKGGPLFFALSLIPLFALLWWLRRGETRRSAIRSAIGGKSADAAGKKTLKES